MSRDAQDLVCVHCLRRGAALRTDRKGRPYIRCVACGATSFLPTGAALRGTIALAPYLVEAARRAAGLGDTESLDEMTERALAVARGPQGRAAGGSHG